MPRTAARSGALALKPGTLLAGICSGWRVYGLIPIRAWRWRSSNVPKPVSVTFSPRCSASLITANAASTTCFAALCDTPVRSATA